MKIAATNLGKRFNREWIFKNLSYDFISGNTYAIVGHNGSGKSTLMQILWGQLPQSKGELVYSINDIVIPGEEIFSSVAIATSYMELIEEFTIDEMIAFHFKFKKIRGEKNVNELLEIFELKHASGKQIMNFSSGMRQRLKLGLAMFSETPALFLDEPTTNLDTKAIDWYTQNLNRLPADLLVLIASNQAHEYPTAAKKLDIADYK